MLADTLNPLPEVTEVGKVFPLLFMAVLVVVLLKKFKKFGEFLDRSFWKSQVGAATVALLVEEVEAEEVVEAAPETLALAVGGKLKLFSPSMSISSTLICPFETDEERRLVI